MTAPIIKPAGDNNAPNKPINDPTNVNMVGNTIANPPNAKIKFCIVGLNSLNRFHKFCINPANFSTAGTTATNNCCPKLCKVSLALFIAF